MKSNKIKLRLSLLLLVLFPVLHSCKGNEEPEHKNGMAYFLLQREMGVYVDGTQVVKYDEYESQIAYNVARRIFRFQTNDQGVYAHLVLSQLPVPDENVPVEVALNYKTGQETRSMQCLMKVAKVEGNLCWLWEEESKTGVILWKNPEKGVNLLQ